MSEFAAPELVEMVYARVIGARVFDVVTLRRAPAPAEIARQDDLVVARAEAWGDVKIGKPPGAGSCQTRRLPPMLRQRAPAYSARARFALRA